MSNVNDLSNYKPKLPFTANGSFLFTAAETFIFNFAPRNFFFRPHFPGEFFLPQPNFDYQPEPVKNVRGKVLRWNIFGNLLRVINLAAININ